VQRSLPPESITFLENVQQTLHVGIKPFKEYDRFKEIINQVNDAAARKNSIEIVYFTMSRKQETKRKVDPYSIWFFNGTFYLIGHCHMRDQVRIFALDRIKMLSRTRDSFEMPEDFDLEEFLRPSFGVFQGEPTRVKIWFSPEIAPIISEKIWHSTQEIKQQKDGSIVFEAEVAGTTEIKLWIMSWGSKSEVLEPERLREEVRAEAEALADKYEKKGQQHGTVKA
jgi:predicted DNA-binding transcriptional regulator YafY